MRFAKMYEHRDGPRALVATYWPEIRGMVRNNAVSAIRTGQKDARLDDLMGDLARRRHHAVITGESESRQIWLSLCVQNLEALSRAASRGILILEGIEEPSTLEVTETGNDLPQITAVRYEGKFSPVAGVEEVEVRGDLL